MGEFPCPLLVLQQSALTTREFLFQVVEVIDNADMKISILFESFTGGQSWPIQAAQRIQSKLRTEKVFFRRPKPLHLQARTSML